MARLLDTRWPRLWLVVLCLALWLPGILLVPPSDRDESRFAQATKQMLETGDLVDIRNGEEARNRKPIGIYWLQLPGVATARALGVAVGNPIWPYRLPSLLGALLAVLCTHALGLLIADRRTALLAAAMLGASVLLSVEANIAKTDAVLVGVTTLAMLLLARAYFAPSASVMVGGGRPSTTSVPRRRRGWSAFADHDGVPGLERGGAAAFWLASGLGVLVKGPVMPMVVGLAVLGLVVVDRRGDWLADLRPKWGVPLMLAVVLPWFVAIGIATHGQFFRDAVGGDLGAKLAGGDDAHGAPPGTHTLLIFLTLFPSAPAIVCAMPEAFRRWREPGTRFLLAWIVPSWLVFEAVPTKLPHYPLPVMPALCLLGAWWLVRGGAVARWVSVPAWTLFGVAALALGGGFLALPFVVGQGVSPRLLLGMPAAAAVALLAWRVWRATDPLGRCLAALACMPLVIWAALGLAVPFDTPLWMAPRLAAVRDAVSPTAPFAVLGFAEPSVMFLAGTSTRLLSGGAAGARFLAEGGGRVLGVESRDLAAFRAANQTPARMVGEVDGFNYSNGRRVAITLFAD